MKAVFDEEFRECYLDPNNEKHKWCYSKEDSEKTKELIDGVNKDTLFEIVPDLDSICGICSKKNKSCLLPDKDPFQDDGYYVSTGLPGVAVIWALKKRIIYNYEHVKKEFMKIEDIIREKWPKDWY